MKLSLEAGDHRRILDRLAPRSGTQGLRVRGPSAREPVHTVYGGAHLFRADLVRKLGELAIHALDTHAPTGRELMAACGVDPGVDPDRLWQGVRAKLEREPVEDYRIDFEDGYGVRPDPEEDEHAVAAATALAEGLAAGMLPPFVGIRIKPLTLASGTRAVRTLDGFLTTFLERTGRKLPPSFVVALPKVETSDQVRALAELLERLEQRHGIPEGALALEILVETPRALVAEDGRIALPDLVAAAGGRMIAAHLGPYDLTASVGITATSQRLDHPFCTFARELMQAALGGEAAGVSLSDGPTPILPVGPHRRPAGGPPLEPRQLDENRRAVHDGWRRHTRHVTRALESGIYRGWDLHPAQLPARYAAVHAFHRRELPGATERLRRFLESSARASRVGQVFDDAASGLGLLGYFRRGFRSGALSEDELRAAGLTLEDLDAASFTDLLARPR